MTFEMSQNQQQQINVELVPATEDASVASGAPAGAGVAPARAAVAVASRTPSSGLGDRLNHVFREIRPIVEHARMGNNSRLSLPTWLSRNTAQPAMYYTSENTINTPHMQSTIAHVNLGPGSQTYVLNDRLTPVVQRQHSDSSAPPGAQAVDAARESEMATDSSGDINISINPAINNNIPENPDNESQSDDGTQQVLDLRALFTVLIKYSPFYLIILAKFMYDSREGLFSFVVLIVTFCQGNSLVRREYGKQASRSVGALFFGFVYTTGCITVVHLLFGHGELLSNIIMSSRSPYAKDFNIWQLIWLVCLTDLIVKIVTVDLKIIVTAMPAIILPLQKRGKVYLFIESVSQLYRSILPIQPWFTFLTNCYQGSEKIVGMFLSTAYVIAKIIELLIRLRLFMNATRTLVQSVNLGTKPTSEQLTSAGESCPICQEEYTTPVRLGCSHIFCELCIAAWLDREHTCPLCRAKVADEPTWRDGSTTQYLQLY